MPMRPTPGGWAAPPGPPPAAAKYRCAMPGASSEDPLAREIASQPDCWARALERAAELGAPLPVQGARALVIGCGTSLHIARAYALLRETGGAGETDWAP